MPKIKYVTKKFSPAVRAVIDQANRIIADYQAQGYVLTIRQLFYRFVATDLLPNTKPDYKRLCDIVSNARLAGLVDWSAIEDRTRNLKSLAHWDSPGGIARAAADSFRVDKWADQPCRVELFVEKEALAGVFQPVCEELDIPFFCCRGYTSQSEMWAAAMRLKDYARADQTPIILHFGDHDPSGIDMTRDIRERLELFMGGMEVRRLALNMDQIEEFEPPPNPAKIDDPRATAYIAQFGESSWELDALEPATLAELVRTTVAALRDDDLWEAAVEREAEGRRRLVAVADNWDELTEGL